MNAQQTKDGIPPDEIYRCDQCGAEEKATDLKQAALYACSKCGVRFVSTQGRCEECNRFVKKVGRFGCMNCDKGQMTKKT